MPALRFADLKPTGWPCELVHRRNNKYIRAKKKVRQEIEDRVLSRYQMKQDRPGGWEYELSTPYETDKGLDEAIYDDILYMGSVLGTDKIVR